MQSKAALAVFATLTFAAPVYCATTPPAAPVPAAAPDTSPAAAPADLTLGSEVVLRLRASAGGLTPQQRVSTIEGRLAAILGSPKIPPSSVTVYTPKGHAPVIYALGRRLITVDAATVKASGDTASTPLSVATRWAKRFQQVLPRVNYRPSNAPETVVPAHPPLTITPDFTKVGGNTGTVSLRGKAVLNLHGPQNGGLTAQERADVLTARLERLAGKAQGTDAVSVSGTNPAVLNIAGQSFLTVDMSEAKLAKVPAATLAGKWAANIRKALNLSDPNTLPPAVSAPAATPSVPVAAPPVAPPVTTTPPAAPLPTP